MGKRIIVFTAVMALMFASFGMLAPSAHANGPEPIIVDCTYGSTEIEVDLDYVTVEVSIKCSGSFSGILFTLVDDEFAFGFELVGAGIDDFCGQLFLMTAMKYETKCVGEYGEAEIEVKFKYPPA